MDKIEAIVYAFWPPLRFGKIGGRRDNRRVTCRLPRRNNYEIAALERRAKARMKRENLIRALERVALEPLERTTFSRDVCKLRLACFFAVKEREREREFPVNRTDCEL